MAYVFLRLLLLTVAGDPLPPPRITAGDDPTKVTVEARLPADALKKLPAGAWSQDLGETWLRFGMVKKDVAGLPLVGSYRRDGDRLIFRPRLALERGAVYRASFGTDPGKAASVDHRVTEQAATPLVKVVKILPGSDVLPANHLRFYIYFSGPMRGGQDIFDQICILDADGKEVADPWLRDELWDDKDQVLIIYIHPGRIKWELLLRQSLGPVLVPGKEFSLVVKGTMLDARGQRLGKDHVKKFRTTAEERSRVPISGWRLDVPAAGTSEPLRVDLPRFIDHNCLLKDLTIKDAKNRVIQGTIALGKNEKSWSFTPKTAWLPGEYWLYVDPRLEDVAGNTPIRPFDVDLKAPVPRPQSLRLKFVCR